MHHHERRTALEKRRHYGRKIKKTKNLYRRKKSAGQKVFGTVMLVIAVSAIAFLGFCIGKPLLDYLGNIGTEQPVQWTPEDSYAALHTDAPEESTAATGGSAVPGQTQGDVSAETATADMTDTGEQTSAATSDTRQTVGTNQPHSTTTQTVGQSAAASPVSFGALVSTEAPASALSNRSSLSAVLAKAKAGGYNSVVIQLKDRNGFLRYKTEITGVADSSVEAGTMTLDEIMSVFQENGLVPIAEIAVLADNKGCEQFPEMSFKCVDAPATSWLEWVEKRRWANPESDATREYFSKITAELVSAGFSNILLTDVIFPNFQHYDSAYIAAKYFAADRYKLLYNVIKSGSLIEMKASDVIGETFGRTAEVLNDTSKLRDNSAAIIISRSDLPKESGYPADAKTLVETVLSLAGKKVGGLKIVPIIDGSGFDDAEKVKIANALGSLGYESYIMR